MGQVIKRDPKERKWREMLARWVDRKITFKELMKYRPARYFQKWR